MMGLFLEFVFLGKGFIKILEDWLILKSIVNICPSTVVVLSSAQDNKMYIEVTDCSNNFMLKQKIYRLSFDYIYSWTTYGKFIVNEN